MDDSLLMGRFEGFGDLLGNRQCLVERDRPLRDAVRQGWPLDQLQDQRPDAIRLLQAVDGADVRMVQRGQHLGFPLEPRQPIGVGRERLGQHLQRHVAIELGVAGLIHLPHPAFADLGGDLVASNALLQSHQITPETVPLWCSFSGGAERGASRESHRQGTGTRALSSSTAGP